MLGYLMLSYLMLGYLMLGYLMLGYLMLGYLMLGYLMLGYLMWRLQSKVCCMERAQHVGNPGGSLGTRLMVTLS